MRDDGEADRDPVAGAHRGNLADFETELDSPRSGSGCHCASCWASACRPTGVGGWQVTQPFVGITYADKSLSRTSTAPHACRADRSRCAGHSLQGVAARRRSRGRSAIDARFSEAGTRAAGDQRPLLSAVPVRGSDCVGHRPRRLRRPRVLRVRNARAKLRSCRLRAGDQHRSRQSRLDRHLGSGDLPTACTCARRSRCGTSSPARRRS